MLVRLGLSRVLLTSGSVCLQSVCWREHPSQKNRYTGLWCLLPHPSNHNPDKWDLKEAHCSVEGCWKSCRWCQNHSWIRPMVFGSGSTEDCTGLSSSKVCTSDLPPEVRCMKSRCSNPWPCGGHSKRIHDAILSTICYIRRHSVASSRAEENCSISGPLRPTDSECFLTGLEWFHAH